MRPSAPMDSRNLQDCGSCVETASFSGTGDLNMLVALARPPHIADQPSRFACGIVRNSHPYCVHREFAFPGPRALLPYTRLPNLPSLAGWRIRAGHARQADRADRLENHQPDSRNGPARFSFQRVCLRGPVARILVYVACLGNVRGPEGLSVIGPNSNARHQSGRGGLPFRPRIDA